MGSRNKTPCADTMKLEIYAINTFKTDKQHNHLPKLPTHP